MTCERMLSGSSVQKGMHRASWRAKCMCNGGLQQDAELSGNKNRYLKKLSLLGLRESDDLYIEDSSL